MTNAEKAVCNFIELNMLSAVRSNNIEIVNTLQHILQFNLPGSYRYLLSNFDFDGFEMDGIEFYGSYELLNKIQQDQPLFMGLTASRMIQIGRPCCGSYDPICFNGNGNKIKGELPLVQVSHEDILMKQTAKIRKDWSLNFCQMIVRNMFQLNE